jgi:hypothetical protein
VVQGVSRITSHGAPSFTDKLIFLIFHEDVCAEEARYLLSVVTGDENILSKQASAHYFFPKFHSFLQIVMHGIKHMIDALEAMSLSADHLEITVSKRAEQVLQVLLGVTISIPYNQRRQLFSLDEASSDRLFSALKGLLETVNSQEGHSLLECATQLILVARMLQFGVMLGNIWTPNVVESAKISIHLLCHFALVSVL